MDTRKAVQETILFCFEHLQERGKIKYNWNKLKEVAYLMHDDDNFLEDLIECIDEHIEVMGENYGLY